MNDLISRVRRKLADVIRGAPPAPVAAEPPKPLAESEYEILPGTAYSRYAVPIEYPPSRDFQPRWGYARPPLEWLDSWFKSYVPNYKAFWSEMEAVAPAFRTIPTRFAESNLPAPAWLDVPYAPFDSMALAAMIKRYQPARYMEIGSGITTCFARMAQAAFSPKTQIWSIDPEPRAQVDAICDKVIREGLEVCDPEIFAQLEPGDILFFDGSHRSFMNSDVTVFFSDILPRLKPGVIVHIHDITLPYDYPDSFKTWYWNEQYLLSAFFLGAMDKIEPLLPTAFICRDESTRGMIKPLVDLPENDGWWGGGAMWFTIKTPLS